MSNQTKPIKRNPALVEFSKDHHFGLLLVWKIRQGLRSGIAPVRISRYVSCSYVADLAQHFADEETYLFPNLSQTDPQRIRAEREHEALRSLVAVIKQNPNDENKLQEYANLLDAHIRFEERELFNRLQAYMQEEQLLKLLQDVPARPHLNDDDWEDRFWARKEKTEQEKSYAG
jgi:hemerythrin superfamily protein